MHLPPGMEWNEEEDVTVMYWNMDNLTSNITNRTDPASFTGATIASPIIMFLTGMIGNLLALSVLHRTRLESQRLMFHSLVAGLVWNDLIGIVMTSPVTVASYINGLQMPGGEHLCRFNGFIMICFGLSTPLIVSAMAIERLLFVKFTFFYTKHCLPGAARLVMVTIWAFVLFFGLLPMFGFGNYVLQYPRTWCFLDFRTKDPVNASYGYIYAILNLLLILTMIVCNLVVVVTLVRVRGYRRKYSNSSLNSVMVADGVMDDSQRQQTVRRRKQKDIELQMIVVMCAITTIFTVCWGPLMIHIILTLATEGKTADFFGLVAVRLASLNQTLNPWLYVILRRALIIRIKKYCCRWKRYLRKKPSFSQPPAGRRHQYVHVRNQLCHRNNFVGAEVKYDSLSHSLRKSLQKAIPEASSLPDVMKVNTDHRSMDIPLPDVAKAESFAGRISHSTDGGLSQGICFSPTVLGFEGHQQEEYEAPSSARRIPELPDGQEAEPAVSKEHLRHLKLSRTNDDSQNNKKPNGAILHKRGGNFADVQTNSEVNGKKNNNSELQTSTDNTLGVCIMNSEGPFYIKHSSHGQNLESRSSVPRLVPVSLTPRSVPARKKRDKDLPVATSDGSFILPHSHLSRFLNKSRNNSKSFNNNIVKTRGQDGLGGARLHNIQHSKRQHVQENAELPDRSDNEIFLDTSVDSDDDDVFHDDPGTLNVETHRSRTLTDDVGFSSPHADSLCTSDTSSLVNPPTQFSVVAHEPLVSCPENNNNADNYSSGFKHHEMATNKIPQYSGHHDTDLTNMTSQPQSLPGHTFRLPHTNSIKVTTVLDQDMSSVSHTNKMNSNTSLPKEDSGDESDKSSGIFSAESPARSSRDMNPKWQLKKESQSEPVHDVQVAQRRGAKRINSCN